MVNNINVINYITYAGNNLKANSVNLYLAQRPKYDSCY